MNGRSGLVAHIFAVYTSHCGGGKPDRRIQAANAGVFMSPVFVLMARYPGGFDDEDLWMRSEGEVGWPVQAGKLTITTNEELP